MSTSTRTERMTPAPRKVGKVWSENELLSCERLLPATSSLASSRCWKASGCAPLSFGEKHPQERCKVLKTKNNNNKKESVTERRADNCNLSLWALVSRYWIENGSYNCILGSLAAPKIYRWFYFCLQKNPALFYFKRGTITRCHPEELSPLQYFVTYQKTKCKAGTLLSNSSGAAILKLIIQASL